MSGFHPDFWQWWVLSVLLLGAEAFAPGFIFLWMGFSAAAVGALVWLIPAMDWKLQTLCFAVLSVASVALWKAYVRHRPQRTDQPLLNRRAEQYVGRVVTLSEPIINGVGKVRIDDSTWRVRGTDCPAGAVVEVINAAGAVLEVRCKS
jgi:membrane protein implicated in regulation of membrane protease activity